MCDHTQRSRIVMAGRRSCMLSCGQAARCARSGRGAGKVIWFGDRDCEKHHSYAQQCDIELRGTAHPLVSSKSGPIGLPY
jgi:hypothetical protein